MDQSLPVLHSKILPCEVETEAFPVIILHGLFGSSDNWLTMGKRMSLWTSVHLLDLRNHGQSFHSDEINYRAMAQDVVRYMDFHGLTQVDLIGHSMGGKVAMQMSNDFPKRCRRMVIVDIAPRAYDRFHDAILDAMNSLRLDTFPTLTEVEKALMPFDLQLSIKWFILKNVKKTPEGFIWQLNLKAITAQYDQIADAPDLKEQIRVPVLFITGEKSEYIQESDTKLIQHYFMHPRIKEVKYAGHWVHVENPEFVYQQMKKFFQ